MTYKEFENQVVNTFNRMHYVENCDDEFMIFGSDCDVSSLLSESFMRKFHIKFNHSTGYYVRERQLQALLFADEDEELIQALQVFNDIMNRYNVIASKDTEHTLHII